MPLVQSIIDPSQKAYPEQYRRMAEQVNGKSRSITSIYLRVVPAALPQQIFRTVVGVNTSLIVKQCSAVAITAGAGGATGLTLRLAGGVTTLDINILPGAAVTTDLGQATLLDYAVPAGATFTVTAQADDHGAGTTPADIMIAFDVRYL